MTNLLFNRCFERERNFIKVTNYSIYYELKILQFGCEPVTKRSNQSLRIFYLFITTKKSLLKKERKENSLIEVPTFSRKRGGDRESRDRVQGRSEGRVHATPV